MAKEKPGPYLGLNKGRAEALTDGIFAFAMTLLVLGIEVPARDAAIQTPDMVSKILRDIYPDISHYLIAFIMLASFWMLHHRCYDRLKAINRKMLWMNVATLMFIALIPFSTDLADDYVTIPLAGLVFSLNMLIVGTLLYSQWSYATGNKDVISEAVKPEEVRIVKRKMMIMPALSMIGIVLAAVGAPWTVLIYILAPILFAIF
jgi:uncharacterized membrane protein